MSCEFPSTSSSSCEFPSTSSTSCEFGNKRVKIEFESLDLCRRIDPSSSIHCNIEFFDKYKIEFLYMRNQVLEVYGFINFQCQLN